MTKNADDQRRAIDEATRAVMTSRSLMPSGTKRAASPVSIKAADVGADGTFTGYGSVFGVVDSVGDVVAPGAFRDSIAAKMPKLLNQHDTTQLIGLWLEASEDERGLLLKGRILTEVEKGREALALMRAGALDGLSIGFEVIDAEWSAAGDYEAKYGQWPSCGYVQPSDQVRVLKKIDLWEVSLVTFPCCAPARVETVKRSPRLAQPPPGLSAALERRTAIVDRIVRLAV